MLYNRFYIFVCVNIEMGSRPDRTPPTLQICIVCHFSQKIYLGTRILHSILCSLFLSSPVSLSKSKGLSALWRKVSSEVIALQSINQSYHRHISDIFDIQFNRRRERAPSSQAILLSPSSLHYLLAIITKRGNRAFNNWLAKRRHGRKDLIIELNEPL